MCASTSALHGTSVCACVRVCVWQLTDVVIVLNTVGAVEAFTGTGQVSCCPRVAKWSLCVG